MKSVAYPTGNKMNQKYCKGHGSILDDNRSGLTQWYETRKAIQRYPREKHKRLL